MKKYFVVLAAISLTASCSKDGGGSNNTSKKDLLTASAWMYESGGLDTNKDGSVDLTFTGLLPACLLDNTGLFKADGSGTTDEGPTKCDPGAPQTSSFNWAFASNETQLSVSGGGLAGVSGTMGIRTLTAARLTLAKDTSVMGLNASIIINLKH